MVLDRSEPRCVQDRLGHQQRNVRHHAQIGVQRAHLLKHSCILVARRLKERQVPLFGQRFQRIDPATFIGRTVHRADVLAAFQQRFQDGFAEGLLAMNDQFHLFLLPVPFPGKTPRGRHPAVYLYIVCALVPGAYSSGSTQTLTTAHLPVLAIASRARCIAG